MDGVLTKAATMPPNVSFTMPPRSSSRMTRGFSGLLRSNPVAPSTKNHHWNSWPSFQKFITSFLRGFENYTPTSFPFFLSRTPWIFSLPEIFRPEYKFPLDFAPLPTHSLTIMKRFSRFILNGVCLFRSFARGQIHKAPMFLRGLRRAVA